jgi:hypothetical protein
MIAFEAPPTGEALENAHAWSFHRRIIIAVMTLLMGVAAVALVAANENAASPSIHTVFACGDTPGFCPNPPSSTTDHTQSTNTSHDAPHSVGAPAKT